MSPVVALWKDPVGGLREIPLEAGAQGILLTLSSDRGTRRSADGRCPVDNVIEQFDVAIHQVRAGNADSMSSNSQPGPLAPCVLEGDELTVLTGWAQALAEALAYAPECVEVLLANAQAGAPWRDEFQLTQPSPQLSQAIQFMRQAITAVTSQGGMPKLDALRISYGAHPREEPRLEMLVRRVLLSMFEQLRTRQVVEIR